MKLQFNTCNRQQAATTDSDQHLEHINGPDVFFLGTAPWCELKLVFEVSIIRI